MARTFRCSIVTPSESVFDDDVSYVSMPSWDGQHGVMVGQSPLLTRLGIGALKIERPGDEPLVYWVDQGFAQVSESVLTILTEHAARPEDLSPAEAETALREANALAVSGGGRRPEERRKVEAAQERARTRLAMAARHGGRRPHGGEG